jgi:hypothetical protein
MYESNEASGLTPVPQTSRSMAAAEAAEASPVPSRDVLTEILRDGQPPSRCERIRRLGECLQATAD